MDTKNSRQYLRWLKSQIPGALLGAIFGALLSIPVSYYFSSRQPPPLESVELKALARLHQRDFEAAATQFSNALAIDPSSSRLWEGKAYAHLGLAYPEKFDLRTVWQNFEIEPSFLGGQLWVAFSCATKALERATDAEEEAKANLVLGLVLELAGYDDYGAVRHGLSPLFYYAAAAKRLIEVNRQRRSPRSVSAIKYTSYAAVIDYAIEHRLRQYEPLEQGRMLKFYLASHPNLIRSYSGRLQGRPGAELQRQ